MAYTIQWELVERQVLNMQLLAGIAQMLGSEVRVPSIPEYRDYFDQHINAPPEPAKPGDAEKAELLRALGVGR